MTCSREREASCRSSVLTCGRRCRSEVSAIYCASSSSGANQAPSQCTFDRSTVARCAGGQSLHQELEDATFAAPVELPVITHVRASIGLQKQLLRDEARSFQCLQTWAVLPVPHTIEACLPSIDFVVCDRGPRHCLPSATCGHVWARTPSECNANRLTHDRLELGAAQMVAGGFCVL